MSRRRGFTLVEMMVALVTGGLLMASLVALSGATRRSFGRAKDITELQANLRFAMKILVDDFSRVAYMVSPDASLDVCHLPIPGGASAAAQAIGPAISYDPATLTYRLTGNYISSRDYRIRVASGNGYVVCRNGKPWAGPGDDCSTGGVGVPEDQYPPFSDGPDFEGVFPENQKVRIDTGDGHFSYHRVQSNSVANNYELIFDPPLNMEIPSGFDWWVSPVTEIEYRYFEDPTIDDRWVLERVWVTTDEDGEPVERRLEIAEWLLPSDEGGFVVAVHSDLGAPNICQEPTTATQLTDGDQNLLTPVTVAAAADIDPASARALVITLRGRTQVEDPSFVLADYDTDDASINFGFDVDGDPDNGLARVRVQRTVVQMRNMGLNTSM